MMEHIKPRDDEVEDFVGCKLKINRGPDEFIGTVTGWSDIGGVRRWSLEAENLAMNFLPSEGWEVYLCEAEFP